MDHNDAIGGTAQTAPTCSCATEPAASSPVDDAEFRVQERLTRIRHKIVVLSGKGGVGKSTVAVNLAVALTRAGHRVGLLDVDIHGPSVPTMLGLQSARPLSDDGALLPIEFDGGLSVMSIGFLLNSPDDPVVWRGPLKDSIIQQFLGDVEWGDLDYLIVDAPPGTGDEPLSVLRLLDGLDGAVIVTTPQEVALSDVRRCVRFCSLVGCRVLGLIENMSGLACPHCGETIDVFSRGGGQSLAEQTGIPFLGAVPLDPKLVEAGDSGAPFVTAFTDSPTGEAFRQAIAPLLALED